MGNRVTAALVVGALALLLTGCTAAVADPPEDRQTLTVTHDFADDVDGPLPATLDSGQLVIPGGPNPPKVVDGAMTHDDGDAPAAGGGAPAAYLIVETDDPLTYIGAEFEFTSAGDGSGVMVLANWASEFGAPLPNSNLHFLVTPIGWTYGIIGPEHAEIILARGEFTEPLPAHKLLEATVTIDGSTATIELPDGTVTSVTDDRIVEWGGSLPTWEIYTASPETQTPVLVHRLWADDA